MEPDLDIQAQLGKEPDPVKGPDAYIAYNESRKELIAEQLNQAMGLPKGSDPLNPPTVEKPKGVSKAASSAIRLMPEMGALTAAGAIVAGSLSVEAPQTETPTPPTVSEVSDAQVPEPQRAFNEGLDKGSVTLDVAAESFPEPLPLDPLPPQPKQK